MNAFKFDLQSNSNQLNLSLAGAMNEGTKLPEINEGPKKLVIDFAGVSFINSLGIRNWLLWISKMGDYEIELFNVNRPILEQVNMVEGFITSKTKIKTISAPFFCDNCDHEEDNLLEEGTHFSLSDKKYHGFEKNCPECEHELELDGKPEKLFRFLK